MDKLSQNTQILDYMAKHGSITSREAMLNLNCMRLASRINELRKSGYPISATMETSTSGARYARYYMEAANG